MKIKIYFILFGSALFIACGGSSNRLNNELHINSSNALEVSSAVVKSSFVNDARTKAIVLTLLSFLEFQIADGSTERTLLEKIGSLARYPSAARSEVVTSECSNGGQFIITYDFSVESTLTPGDSLLLDATNCFIGFEDTYDGYYELIIQDFTEGDQGQVMLVNYNFRNLTISNVNGSTTIDGDTFWNYDTVKNPLELDIRFLANRLTLTTYEDQYVLQDHEYSGADSENPDQSIIALSGGLYIRSLNASVNFESTSMVRASREKVIEQGSIKINGANNSSITLRILTPNEIMIDVDENGDDVIDTTLETDWDALLE